MTILAAAAEVLSVAAFVVIVLAAAYVLAQRTGLNARWARYTQPDLTVRRPRESPVELHLRRQRDRRNSVTHEPLGSRVREAEFLCELYAEHKRSQEVDR